MCSNICASAAKCVHLMSNEPQHIFIAIDQQGSTNIEVQMKPSKFTYFQYE